MQMISLHILAKPKLKNIFLASAYGNEISVCHQDALLGDPVNIFHVDIIALMRLRKGAMRNLTDRLSKRTPHRYLLSAAQMDKYLMAQDLKI